VIQFQQLVSGQLHDHSIQGEMQAVRTPTTSNDLKILLKNETMMMHFCKMAKMDEELLFSKT
jgi:hypothetical protein